MPLCGHYPEQSPRVCECEADYGGAGGSVVDPKADLHSPQRGGHGAIANDTVIVPRAVRAPGWTKAGSMNAESIPGWTGGIPPRRNRDRQTKKAAVRRLWVPRTVPFRQRSESRGIRPAHRSADLSG